MTGLKAPPLLVLASSSQSRARLLEQAGVAFSVVPARVDEDSIKDAMLSEAAKHAHIADTLAEIKSLRVSTATPTDLVIGADQILSYAGRLYSKPVDMDEAGQQLTELSGKTHELITAVCVAKGGQVIWRHIETARMSMRRLSDDFRKEYLLKMGDAALYTVGCYQLEGLGVQLFDKIDGDYFSILGLPMVPLLAFLRNHEVVPT